MAVQTAMRALRADDVGRFAVCVAAGIIQVNQKVTGKALLEHAYMHPAPRVFRFLVDAGAPPIAGGGFTVTEFGVFSRLMSANDLVLFRELQPLLLRMGRNAAVLRRSLFLKALSRGLVDYAEAVMLSNPELGSLGDPDRLFLEVAGSWWKPTTRAAWTAGKMERFVNAVGVPEGLKGFVVEAIRWKLGVDVVTVLLDAGGDRLGVDDAGSEFTRVAVIADDPSVLMMLRERGLVRGQSDDGGFVVHLAAYWRKYSVLPLLIEWFPEQLNALDSSGFTPFMEAVNRGELRTMRALAALGCDLDVRNHAGMDASLLAESRERFFEDKRCVTVLRNLQRKNRKPQRS